MRRLLSLVAFFATLQASAQQVNPVPDYVFRNQMSVGRNAVTDTAAYFSIGPRYGATKGFMPPIVGDTATFSSGKRNGLLIFSVQKNKFLYWDSVRVQWSDMAGSSGSYITGSGITGYLPQFSASTTLDTSALFTLGNRLGIGSSTFAYNSTNTANVELNGTAGGILGFKRNDSARGYLWHTGDNMELANTAAGSISFNTNSATRGSISSAGVWRLHNLAGTGDRVVVASSNGTLSASTSVTGLVDTTTISTRAWRQKGDDSLGAIIATKGSGTVTSVATGYGLSGGTITTTGTLLVDTLNIATRAWRQKGLDSLAALEVSGSGTTNYVPKFTAGSTIGNSQIFDNGTNVGIGTASPASKLDVNGDVIALATSFTPLSLRRDISSATAGVVANFQLKNGSNAYVDYAWVAGGIVNATTGSHEGFLSFHTANAGSISERGRFNNNGELLINTTSDAGDYKLQVSGNIYNTGSAVLAATSGEAYIGTTSDAGDYKLQVSGNALVTAGKLDITTNTAFGIGIARSGTSEVAGQIYNSNGILYTGVESSAGGQIFSGSSAYAAVIGSGANYPLQFATNNATRATINTNGELLINTTTDNGDFKLQVNGNALISGSIKTANGTSSTAVPWHLGSVVATNVQLDTANYVEVEINGTFYRLAIVTPL